MKTWQFENLSFQRPRTFLSISDRLTGHCSKIECRLEYWFCCLYWFGGSNSGKHGKGEGHVRSLRSGRLLMGLHHRSTSPQCQPRNVKKCVGFCHLLLFLRFKYFEHLISEFLLKKLQVKNIFKCRTFHPTESNRMGSSVPYQGSFQLTATDLVFARKLNTQQACSKANAMLYENGFKLFWNECDYWLRCWTGINLHVCTSQSQNAKASWNTT